MDDNAGPAAKRLRADARRNRDQVLAIAREMLAAGGSSVSFDEIARRAGVGVGTVYRHFPTRSALFEAVILGRVEEFIEKARTLAAASTGPEDIFRGYFTHLVGEVVLNQALCEALDDGSGAAFAIPSQLRRDFIRSFDVLLSQAKEAGSVRLDVDIADVLDLLIGAATAERRARLRSAPNNLVTVVLDGLRVHPQEGLFWPLPACFISGRDSAVECTRRSRCACSARASSLPGSERDQREPRNARSSASRLQPTFILFQVSARIQHGVREPQEITGINQAIRVCYLPAGLDRPAGSS